MHKLSGEQCKVLYLPDQGNIVLLGSAGSGKSLVSLYRAIYYLVRYPERKCCLVCYNEPLKQKLNKDFEMILSDLNIKEPGKKSLGNRIEIKTCYTLLKDTINGINSNNGYFLTEGKESELKSIQGKDIETIIEKAIEKIKKQHKDNRILSREIRFYSEEIAWLQGMRIESVEEYDKMERLGRGRKDPVNRGIERKIIYSIFEEYKRIRLEEYTKKFDFNDVSWLLLEHSKYICEDDKFDYLIIDEFQDMNKAQIQALTRLTQKNSSILLLGDYAQQIIGTKVSFKQLGIDNIKKESLSKNYRNTMQIANIAESILEKGFIYEDEDEKINRVISKKEGIIPVLKKVRKDEYIELIDNFFIDKKGSKGIILMNKKNCYIDAIKNLDSSINAYTINRVKGLEFDNLLILDIDEIEYLRDLENIGNNENNEIAKQLYVSITRAKKNLCIAYTKYNMKAYWDLAKIEVDDE